MEKKEDGIKKEPITLDRNDVIQTKQIPYLLHEGDYLRLTKIHSFLPIWAHSLFAGMSIYLINLLAKYISHNYFNSTENVSFTEWITLAIIFILVLIFESLYFFLPSDKKKTIKIIDEHFKKYN